MQSWFDQRNINVGANVKSPYMIYNLYSINNGEIPKPYSIIDRSLESPFENDAYNAWEEKLIQSYFVAIVG